MRKVHKGHAKVGMHVHLQRIFGHVVEDVEQSLQLELGQMTRFQGGRLHVVAVGQHIVRFSSARILHRRIREGGIKDL
jgi:hypothetical protein